MAKQQDEVLSLNERNIIGMLQREMFEMDIYLRQPAQLVSKHVLMAGLAEMHKFISMLPEPAPVENGKAARN